MAFKSMLCIYFQPQEISWMPFYPVDWVWIEGFIVKTPCHGCLSLHIMGWAPSHRQPHFNSGCSRDDVLEWLAGVKAVLWASDMSNWGFQVYGCVCQCLLRKMNSFPRHECVWLCSTALRGFVGETCFAQTLDSGGSGHICGEEGVLPHVSSSPSPS